MPTEFIVGVRDLARRTSTLINQVAGGQPFLITRNGQPVAMLVPVEEGLLEDFVLATASDYREAQRDALQDLKAGHAATQAEMENEAEMETEDGA